MDLERNDLYTKNNVLCELIEKGIVIDEETGAFFDSTDLEEVKAGVIEKNEACAFVLEKIKARRQEAELQKKRYEDNIKYFKNCEEALERHMIKSVELCGGKIETGNFRISTRKSTALEIIDENAIPKSYMSTPKPPAPKPDKIKIKKAFCEGVVIPGAALVTNKHLVVK